MTAFSAYFNGKTVYINGKKKYVLGEILEKILDKRYRELDKLYSECRRYEAILHYPEDMREADESEEERRKEAFLAGEAVSRGDK